MTDHLSRDAIERLIHRRCHASRAYGWLLHLLACAECREYVVQSHPGKGERFLREIFRTQEPLRSPDLDNKDRLDRVLANLQTHGLLEFVQEGEVPPLLAELDRHPPERQRLILDNTERLWNLTTVEFLFERCEREYHRNPRHGQSLAEQALSVLDRLSPDHYHPSLLHDLRARAWGLRGNFLRIRGRFASARQDLRRAEESLDSGTGDIDEHLYLLQTCGAMAADQRRFRDSLAIRKKTRSASRAAGNRAMELNSVISLVGELREGGRLHEAIELGEQYLEQVSFEHDGPMPILMLKANLAAALGEAGRGLPAYRLHREAIQLLPKNRPRLATFLQWQQLVIFESLGDLAMADEIAQSITIQVLGLSTLDYFGSLMTDRARLAIKRGDRARAREYGREAHHIYLRNGHLDLAQAVLQMVEGGPLIHG